MGISDSLLSLWAYSSSIAILRFGLVYEFMNPLSLSSLRKRRSNHPKLPLHVSKTRTAAQIPEFNATYRSCQNLWSSLVVLSAPLILAKRTFGPTSPSPQNTLQKSRFSRPWKGSTPFVRGGTFLVKEVVLRGEGSWEVCMSSTTSCEEASAVSWEALLLFLDLLNGVRYPKV